MPNPINNIQVNSGFMYEFDKTLNAYKPYFLKVRVEDIIGTPVDGSGNPTVPQNNIPITNIVGLAEKLTKLEKGSVSYTDEEERQVETYVNQMMQNITKYNPKKIYLKNLKYQLYNNYGICNLDFITGMHHAIYNIPLSEFMKFTNGKKIDIEFDGVLAALAFTSANNTVYNINTTINTAPNSQIRNYTITHVGTSPDDAKSTFTISSTDSIFTNNKSDSIYNNAKLMIEYKAFSRAE